MRKLIVKTALISFVSAVGAILLFIGFCALFLPAFTSNVLWNMGMYSSSANFAKKAYEDSGENARLIALVERSIVAGNDSITIEYGRIFIESDFFLDYAKTAQSEQYSGNYAGYIVGNIAVSQYDLGKKDDALQTVKNHLTSYTEYNAVQYLMRVVFMAEDKEFAGKIQGYLNGLSLEGEEAQILAKDVALLDNFINYNTVNG